jgi:hypothetical protein
LEAGAHGYLIQSEAIKALVDAIKALVDAITAECSGRIYLAPPWPRKSRGITGSKTCGATSHTSSNSC